MFQAGWKIEELNALLSEVRQLIVDSQTLIDVFDCESVQMSLSQMFQADSVVLDHNYAT